MRVYELGSVTLKFGARLVSLRALLRSRRKASEFTSSAQDSEVLLDALKRGVNVRALLAVLRGMAVYEVGSVCSGQNKDPWDIRVADRKNFWNYFL